MTDVPVRIGRPAPARRPVPPMLPAGVGVLCLGVVAALALVAGVERTSVSVPLVLAGGVALLAFVALVVTRFDAAVALAVGLTAVVQFEPAPTDAAFALILAVAAVTGRLRLGDAPGSIRFFVAALLALNLLSMVDAFDVALAVRFSTITAYLAVLALWLSTWIDSAARARLVVVAWLVVALASATVSIIAFNVTIPGRDIFLGNGGTRGRGLFKDANVYGPFLVPIAVIMLEQRIRPRLLHLSGWSSAVIITVLTLGILYSFSRASWLNFVLATGVMLAASALTRHGGARATRTLLTLLVAGTVVLGVLGATGSLDFLEQRAQVQSYDTERFGAQRAGYELGWTYPAGVGPGQFQFHHDVESHSTYVRVLAEQGFGGLIAWIGLALSTLVLAARNTIRGTDSYGIGASALLGAWCGLILNSAVVDTLHWRHLWLVAALIWVGALRERRGSQASVASGRSPAVALAGAPGGTPK